MLTIPDVTKPSKEEMNTSDFVVRGVLLQGGHLIAYESRS